MNKFYAPSGLLFLFFILTAFNGQANTASSSGKRIDVVTATAKKDQTVTFRTISNQVYGTKLTLSATASSGLPVTFKVISGPVSIEDNVLRVTGTGEVSIAAVQAGNEVYNSCTVVRNFKALRKKIKVAVVPVTKIYGDKDPEFTVTVTPALVEGDAFTGALERAPGENVGRYLISAGTLDIKDCYDVDCQTDYLEILKKTIEVKANPLSKAFGTVDPVLTYTFSPALVGTDAFEGQLSRTPGEARGLYPILQNTLALSSNYTLVFSPATFEVIKPIKPLALLKANNIITPNGDGKNDFLVFDDLENYPSNELKIFDHASRIIYVKKGYDNSFDGKLSGERLAEGSYYYIMDFGPGNLKIKGFFNVIHDRR